MERSEQVVKIEWARSLISVFFQFLMMDLKRFTLIIGV